MQTLGGLEELLVLGTAGTTGAIAVLRDLNSDTEGAKVRNLAEKIHGRFRVAVLPPRSSGPSPRMVSHVDARSGMSQLAITA